MLDTSRMDTFKQSVKSLLEEPSLAGLVCLDDLQFKEEYWCAYYYRLVAENDKIRLSCVFGKNGVSVFSLSLFDEETGQWHIYPLGEDTEVAKVNICEYVCGVLNKKPK